MNKTEFIRRELDIKLHDTEQPTKRIGFALIAILDCLVELSKRLDSIEGKMK